MNIELKDRNRGDESRVFRAWVAALLGGAWGGAIVGLAEALSITLTGGPGEDYWLFPYGVVTYGLFGLLAGAGVAVLVTLPPLRRWRPRAFGISAALAFFVFGGAVARYNLNLRVFHEELVTFSAVGLAVHLALALVVGGLALLLVLLGTRVQRAVVGSCWRRRRWWRACWSPPQALSWPRGRWPRRPSCATRTAALRDIPTCC